MTSRSPGWPAVLRAGSVELRPLRLRDGPAWTAVRLADQAWLERWEAAVPGSAPTWRERHAASVWVANVRARRREAREGRGLPFAVRVDGALVGQLSVGGVVRGAADSAHLGYWVASRAAGRGIAPTAVALAVDHCFGPVGLHRVEAAVRPENRASRRVLEKLAFREEGLRPRYLFIDGAWRDHLVFALTVEDLADEPGGLLGRWGRTRRNRS